MTRKQNNTEIAAELADILTNVPTNPAADETFVLGAGGNGDNLTLEELGAIEHPDESTSDQALAAIVNQIEAKQDAIDAQTATGTSTTIDLTGDQPQSDDMPLFSDILGAIDDDTKKDMAQRVSDAIDARIERLKRVAPDNDSQPATLNKLRSKMAMPSRAAVLVAVGTDETFIDDSRSTGNHYNVYAIDKVADLVATLSGDQMRNAINRAVTRSLFQFRAAGQKFTGEHAKAAASDKIRISDKTLEKLLIRHTVSAGTAPTQASSTMQALQTLGIVTNTGTVKFPVYELTDSPQTHQLEKILKAA